MLKTYYVRKTLPKFAQNAFPRYLDYYTPKNEARGGRCATTVHRDPPDSLQIARKSLSHGCVRRSAEDAVSQVLSQVSPLVKSSTGGRWVLFTEGLTGQTQNGEGAAGGWCAWEGGGREEEGAKRENKKICFRFFFFFGSFLLKAKGFSNKER